MLDVVAVLSSNCDTILQIVRRQLPYFVLRYYHHGIRLFPHYFIKLDPLPPPTWCNARETSTNPSCASDGEHIHENDSSLVTTCVSGYNLL